MVWNKKRGGRKVASILSIGRNLFRSLTGNAVLKIHTAAGKTENFVCQFNPDEYKIRTQGKFITQERRENNSPIIQYIGGAVSVLNLTLFFDTSASTETTVGVTVSVKNEEASDVSAYTNQLLALVKIAGEMHRPPIVEFCWGSLSFAGFVSQVDVQYVMFEKGGMPVRAKVDLVIQSQDLSVLNEAEENKEDPKESPDRTKCRIVTEDSNIWNIAQLEYDDVSKWREIARANHIMNPLEIQVGTALKVPALE